MKRKEEEITRELALKEQKRKELYAKQGRGSQFTTKVHYNINFIIVLKFTLNIIYFTVK
jgi:hypothetical protein